MVSGTTARTLGVIRLSVETDNTTSPARQRELIEHAAKLRGSEIVGWAQDVDVSASKVHPMKRPELASWLARPDEYDEILFWRTDRLVRKVTDLHDMIRWAEQHGKTLASATEPLDLSTPLGKGIATMVAVFAELEAAATRERVLGAHAYLRDNGRFAGGKPPYGCLAVPVPDGKGWTLIEDPETAPVVREAVRRVIGGEAVNAVCADFNRRGMPTPLDARRKVPEGVPWRTASMRRMLRSPALLGYAVHQGRAVTGSDGMPVIRGVPLLTQSEFDRLQRALDVASKGPMTRSQTTSLLLGVAHCMRCGSPDDLAGAARLYRGTRGTWNRGPRIPHYVCAHAAKPAEYAGRCNAPSILAAELEEAAESAFLGECGDEEQLERIWRPGEDHSDELAQARAALANVRAEYDRGGYVYPGGQADYDERTARLSAHVAALAALPSRPGGYEERGTGRTIRKVWEASSAPERRQLMIAAGFILFAEKITKDSAYGSNAKHGSSLLVASVRGEQLVQAAKAAVVRDIRPAREVAG